ncbi:MAG: DegT/DnrJ/EryC1/StrS family aminotransferase, partial [Clostridia bacterium]
NKIAQKYTNMLKDKFVTPLIEEGFESSWAQYTLILNDNDEREKLQEKLKQLDIPTMVYYPIPMHKQTAYKGYNFNLEDLKTSEELAKCVMSIPMHPYLNDADIKFVTNKLLDK